jgi:PTS system nitrogen regulatory IIA component
MQVSELLDLERISCNTHAASKKRVLEQLSQLLAASQTQLTQNQVFDSLLSRERLGSTGLGRGVAIPHGRVSGSNKTVLAMVKLQEGIDYDAVDSQPVDLLFALLVPEHSTDEHLQLLSQLAEMLSDGELVSQLRQASDARSLLNILREWQQKH